VTVVATAAPVLASTVSVDLGTSSSFGMLGSTITSTGVSNFTRDVGGYDHGPLNAGLTQPGHIEAAVFGEARSMAITFSYDPALKILFTKAEGLLSLADLLSNLDNERYREALKYRELVDASAAWTNVTPGEARRLVLRLRTMMPNGLLGPKAVVTNDRYFYGIARMFSILSDLEEGPRIGIFQTVDEALEWLEREAPVL